MPKSRHNLDDRQWLCHLHLREHNAHWDFFAGMSHEDIQRFCLDAITGHRPTWPLGKRAAASPEDRREPDRAAYASYHFEDGFAVFEEAAEPAESRRQAPINQGAIGRARDPEPGRKRQLAGDKGAV